MVAELSGPMPWSETSTPAMVKLLILMGAWLGVAEPLLDVVGCLVAPVEALVPGDLGELAAHLHRRQREPADRRAHAVQGADRGDLGLGDKGQAGGGRDGVTREALALLLLGARVHGELLRAARAALRALGDADVGAHPVQGVEHLVLGVVHAAGGRRDGHDQADAQGQPEGRQGCLAMTTAQLAKTGTLETRDSSRAR